MRIIKLYFYIDLSCRLFGISVNLTALKSHLQYLNANRLVQDSSITFAGIPTALLPAGICLSTTAFAPIHA